MSKSQTQSHQFYAILGLWTIVIAVLALCTESNAHWDGGGDGLWFHLRLPRLVLGTIIGAQLALSGLLLQCLFRNPLAEPYVLGISSGASLGTVLWILFISNWISIPLGIEISGAIGAAFAVWAVMRLGRLCGLSQSPAFVLVGIAIGAGLHAITAMFLIQADPNKIRDALVWLMGSLAYKSWLNVWITLPVFLLVWGFTQFYARGLDVFSIGEEEAQNLGLNLEKCRFAIIMAAVLLAGSATAAVGIVGFVGLIAPNLVKMTMDGTHKKHIPLTIWTGALLVITADWATRFLAPNRELPIGILTSIAGCFFFILILKTKHK